MNKKGLTAGKIVGWVIGIIVLMLFLLFLWKIKTGAFPSVFNDLIEVLWSR
jgi:hypothetical protein